MNGAGRWIFLRRLTMVRLILPRSIDHGPGDDLLIGAEAIAKELNWRTPAVAGTAVAFIIWPNNAGCRSIGSRSRHLCPALKIFFEQLDQPFIEGRASTEQP